MSQSPGCWPLSTSVRFGFLFSSMAFASAYHLESARGRCCFNKPDARNYVERLEGWTSWFDSMEPGFTGACSVVSVRDMHIGPGRDLDENKKYTASGSVWLGVQLRIIPFAHYCSLPPLCRSLVTRLPTSQSPAREPGFLNSYF